MFTRILKHNRNRTAKRLYLQARRRLAFTLVELLMVVAVIGILATFVMVALAGVNQSAKEDRTTVQISKVHELLMDKYQEYQHRRMPPVNGRLALSRQKPNFEAWLDANGGYALVAQDRLIATREMMRMELPSSKDEVVGPNANGQSLLLDPLNPSPRNPLVPALSRAYYRKAQSMTNDPSPFIDSWTPENESAECLYLIVSQLRDANVSALEFFSEQEIGDTDSDGMLELLDSWDTPILWQRWVPGFLSNLQVSLAEQPEQEDMFDPMQIGDAYDPAFPTDFPRALVPLIFSAGPDGLYGFTLQGDLVGDNSDSWFSTQSNPYHPGTRAVGQTRGDGWIDNITNHLIATR